MSSTDTTGIPEESSFEIIGDGQPSETSEIEIRPTSSPESKVGEIFLRHRQRNKKATEENKNPDSDLDLSAVQLALENVEEKLKIKSNSESNSKSVIKCKRDKKAKGGKNKNSRVKLNLEEEILKLKAKVKSLSKFKSRVQQPDSSDDDDEDSEDGDDDEDESKEDEIETDKNESGKTSRVSDSVALELILQILTGLAAVITVLFLVVCYEHVQQGRVREIIKGTAKSRITNPIFLHSEKNYEGLKRLVHTWDLNDNLCYNLDSTANDFASSIDTQEECVYVFKDSDCRGKRLKIFPDTQNQHDLSLWGLDKAISSLRACYKHKDD